jgi:hypothetical protein
MEQKGKKDLGLAELIVNLFNTLKKLENCNPS